MFTTKSQRLHRDSQRFTEKSLLIFCDTLGSDFPISASSDSTVPSLSAGVLSTAWSAWAIVTAIAFALVGLIISAPLMQSSHPAFAASIYKTFSFVCHQI